MDPTRADVLDWLEGVVGARLTPAAQADVLAAARCDGDAAEALMGRFAARFGVDMRGYRPDMHHRRAGDLLRPNWPFPVQPRHGVLVPVSVSLLHGAAVARRWPVRYPDLPASRDLSFANLPLVMLGLVAATLLVLWLVPRIF